MESLLKRVSEVNSKIAQLDKERLVAKSKKDMIENALFSQIKEYSERFGVNLEGKTISEVEAKIKAEVATISKKCEEELVLKEAVVEAIKSGDVGKARKLLGIKEEAPAQPESRVNATEVVYEPDEEEEEISTDSFAEEDEEEDLGFEDDFDVAEATDGSMEEEVKEEHAVEEESEEEPVEDGFEALAFDDDSDDEVSFGGDDDDDDEEEGEFLFGNTPTSVGRGTAELKQKLSSVEKSVEDVEKASQAEAKKAGATEKKPSGSFLFDDDDDGDSFGFKDLLGGSKFLD